MKVPRLRRLRTEHQAEVEERLLAGNFESYRKLSAELRRRFSHHISPSALWAHRQRLLSARAKQQEKGDTE